MITLSAEEKFMRAYAARWMLRLIEAGQPFNDYFFTCSGWIIGSLRELTDLVIQEIKAPAGRTKEATAARHALKELSTVTHRLDDELEDVAKHQCLRGPIRTLLEKKLGEASKGAGKISSQQLYKRLHSLFGLDSKAGELCIFAYGLGQYRALEHLFEDSLEIMRHSNRALFGRILGINPATLGELRYALEGMGILESGHNTLRLSDSVEYALMAPRANTLQSLFCRPLLETDVELEEFHISEEDRQHALKLLDSNSGRPVHVLLYGAPGSGKTSFASALAQKLGVRAWAAECGTKDDTQDRRASLTACLKLSMQNQGSFVLVDEAERLLDTGDGDLREVSAKAWINDLLERENTRIIWITNKVSHLDPAVRRRFSYSIHFKNPGRAESLSMWKSVAKRTGTEAILPQNIMEKFSQLYAVPVATMEMAIRQAQEHAAPDAFTDWVERVLRAQTTLQNNGRPQRRQLVSPTAFDSGAICVSTPVASFLTKVQNLARRMEENPEAGMGTMLFYGPPGTGKTELARHTARILNKELLIRRASDLLGPFVGETEHNIAEAFAMAEAQKAILLIDEADSFLSGREGAQHSWEATMVNEFLTQLEMFPGICICTTNFREVLDSAAMRRFTLKLGFKYAGPTQLEQLYLKILAPLVREEASEKLLKELRKQKNLAPGDFKAVRQSMWLEDQPTHEQMLKALIMEQKLKLERESKTVGF